MKQELIVQSLRAVLHARAIEKKRIFLGALHNEIQPTVVLGFVAVEGEQPHRPIPSFLLIASSFAAGFLGQVIFRRLVSNRKLRAAIMFWFGQQYQIFMPHLSRYLKQEAARYALRLLLRATARF